jgi:hypothetical protein
MAKNDLHDLQVILADLGFDVLEITAEGQRLPAPQTIMPFAAKCTLLIC